LIQEAIEAAEKEGKGWVLSGYPREMEEAGALSKVGLKPDIVLEASMTVEARLEQIKNDKGLATEDISSEVSSLSHTCSQCRIHDHQ